MIRRNQVCTSNRIRRAACCLLFVACWWLPVTNGQEIRFERRIIDANFPGAYQIEVADVNGDKKPDIVVVGGGTCSWYENPTWKKRSVSSPKQTPGIISSATRDITGDGRAEIAIAYDFAMSQPTRGKLGLAVQGADPDSPWTLSPIADVGSIHRLRWGDLDGDSKPELVAAPIFGPKAAAPRFDQEGAQLRVYFVKLEPDGLSFEGERLEKAFCALHAIDVVDRDQDGRCEILTASYDGVVQVTRTSGRLAALGEWQISSIAQGAAAEPPHKGSSEIHVGRLNRNRPFIATIEPWHGSEVVLHVAALGTRDQFGPRSVIDDTLADGHALWVADVDGDGDDEVFAGHRGKNRRVSMYDFDRAGKTWRRIVLDLEVAAQDLRGGDLDGDGRPDVVAVGGATHNVVWYRFP
jgi:hypothetical protein